MRAGEERERRPCTEFQAWAFEDNGEVRWSWTCDCGRDGMMATLHSFDQAITDASEAHRG